MKKRIGLLLLLVGLILPVSASAANVDVVKHIRDQNSDFFHVEYDSGYDIIVARGDINNIISDKNGIVFFNVGVSYVLFSDAMEKIEESTGIMFIGYTKDNDGGETSKAVLYFSPDDIKSLRALGMIDDREAYRYASKYAIVSQFSQYLKSYDADKPINEDDPIDKLVIFSLIIEKDSLLPDVK